MRILKILLLSFSFMLACRAPQPETPRRIDGYRGIWFTLGQFFPHGDKYSGGLGTYTAKHHPLAIYSARAQKTFFVYGGTTSAQGQHLLAMIGYYDHQKDKVPHPVVVHDKQGVQDPHDNPSLSIDGSGHLWVFVSGRARVRPGFIYKSSKPFQINGFERIDSMEFAYPQPWWIKNRGFIFLFTRYTRGRELYWMTSKDGISWSPAQKLVNGGHYQMSNQREGTVITAFNSHPDDGYVDGRTNLYFLKTNDLGKTWRTADNTIVNPPLKSFNNAALVRKYRSEKRLVYLKDIGFDHQGNPLLLYITSNSHKPGPEGSPRQWTLAHWSGNNWLFHVITESTHNYDMGSLYVEESGIWKIIAPTEPGPQHWGTGGEIAIWTSDDRGKTWHKNIQLTRNSIRNHTYIRRPRNAHAKFYAFWADGNPDSLSLSRLYFTDKTGKNIRILPYEMERKLESPKYYNIE